jgi:hypothetical protein
MTVPLNDIGFVSNALDKTLVGWGNLICKEIRHPHPGKHARLTIEIS